MKRRYFIIPIVLIVYLIIVFSDIQIPIFAKNYEDALIYCSHFKKLETQDSCRVKATKQFVNLGESYGQKKKDCN